MKAETLKRYIVFMIAVCLGGFGIALFTKGAIGVTPIASVSYVFSLHCPLSLGGVTFLFHIVLITLQYYLIPKDKRRENWFFLLVQFPITVVFSLAIDGAMWFLHVCVPESWSGTYLLSLMWIALGCLTLGVGISLQIIANVAMVTGEATVKLIAARLKVEFGYVKLGFDLTLVCVSVVTSLIFTGFSEVEGVREGTIVGALLVGPLVRLIRPRLAIINHFFYSKSDRTQFKTQQLAGAAQFKGTITIAREYGCGGHALGQKLSHELNLKYYDTSLIDLIAAESGVSKQQVAKRADSLESSLLQDMIFSDFSGSLDKSLSTPDALFVATSRVMRKLAKDESCVFIGYNGDFILKDNPRALRVFLYANPDYKLQYCKEHYEQNAEQAQQSMEQTDRRRQEHHQHYAGSDLYDPRNYDLCLDLGSLGEEACLDIIVDAYKKLQEHPRTGFIHKSYEGIDTEVHEAQNTKAVAVTAAAAAAANEANAVAAPPAEDGESQALLAPTEGAATTEANDPVAATAEQANVSASTTDDNHPAKQ